MIFEGSRYEFSDLVRITDHKGDQHPAVYRPPTDVEFRFSEYTWEEGDRVDQLAYRFFKDPELWWILSEANPEYPYLSEIDPGTKIRVPVLA